MSDIDWNMPATLDAIAIQNLPSTMPPRFDGSLRACLERVQAWPASAVPTIHTDAPVMGKTAFDRAAISELIEKMPK